MPPPRFRLRSLLIAVAVVAATMGGGVESARVIQAWNISRERAAMYAQWEQADRTFIRNAGQMARGLSDSHGDSLYRGILQERIDRAQRRADDLARLRRKWEHAAVRPWLPVEPDPPAPEWWH
jgi:hypothetical protein